jgi:predicted regulator of Ras-like GTPase activity (Roadblock/LC7/MglB family)
LTTDLSSLSAPALDVAATLSDFNQAVAGVQQTVAVGPDGLLIVAAETTHREYADRLAAVVSGLRSLAEGGAHLLGNNGVRQVIVEFHYGHLLVASVSGRYDVGVRVSGGCDLGAVGYELALLMERLDTAMSDEVIRELKNSLVD